MKKIVIFFQCEQTKKLFEKITPRLTLKHRVTYSTLTSERAQDLMARLNTIMEKHSDNGVNSISLPTDMWTSADQAPFMSLTVHYMNEEWEMCLWVIRVATAHFPHNAQQLEVKLDEMIEKIPVCKNCPPGHCQRC